MTDEAVVLALDAFHREIRARIKGVKTETVWHLYGDEADYVLERSPPDPSAERAPGGDGDDLEARGWSVDPKGSQAWEAYVLYNSGGVLTGKATGRPEPGGRTGWTGRIVEDPRRQHFHQLLPAEYARVAAACGVSEAGLLARRAWLARWPVLASCHLHFFEYLRAVYRIATEEEMAILREVLAPRAPLDEADLDEFLAEAERVNSIVKGEARPCVLEVDGGRIRVYAGKDKRSRRLINGWVWGEAPASAATTTRAAGGPGESDYEERIRGAPFRARAEALVEEAARLIEIADAPDLIDLAVRARDERLEKALRTADGIAAVVDLATLDAARRAAVRALVAGLERDLRLVAGHGRLLASWGIDVREVCARYAPAVARLKAKVAALREG